MYLLRERRILDTWAEVLKDIATSSNRAVLIEELMASVDLECARPMSEQVRDSTEYIKSTEQVSLQQ